MRIIKILFFTLSASFIACNSDDFQEFSTNNAAVVEDSALGATYEGGYNQSYQYQGVGRVRQANGDYYEGEFDNGLYHYKTPDFGFLYVKSVIIFNNGWKYTGDFESGKAHGYGKYYKPVKGLFSDYELVYKGEFENGTYRDKKKNTIVTLPF